jgi:dienelactone hydrolase
MKNALRAVAGLLFCAAGTAAQTPEHSGPFVEVFYSSGNLRIEAYLYKPEGKGPFPVVIYNHGSRPGNERAERPFAYVGKMLAAEGYLVLVPERRGYGKSEGSLFSEEVGEDRGPRYVARLQQEADDVVAAAEYAKTLPEADPSRIAVMGWSFGGIVSVFAASHSALFRAIVDQAGGALSWDGSPALQVALKEAAGKIRIPLLGMVAENDRTTKSVRVVVDEGKKKGTAKLIVYPAFKPRENPNGVAPGHMIFGAEGSHVWEADLEEFLKREMGK